MEFLRDVKGIFLIQPKQEYVVHNDTVVNRYCTWFTFHCKTQSMCIVQINIPQERAQIERLHCQKPIKEQWLLSPRLFSYISECTEVTSNNIEYVIGEIFIGAFLYLKCNVLKYYGDR